MKKLAFLLILIVFLTGCSITGEYINVYSDDPFDPEQECVLSLCDCQCYPQGQTPEELENKLCGNDCYGRYHIEKCEMTDEGCRIVYKENVIMN